MYIDVDLSCAFLLDCLLINFLLFDFTLQHQDQNAHLCDLTSTFRLKLHTHLFSFVDSENCFRNPNSLQHIQHTFRRELHTSTARTTGSPLPELFVDH